VNPLERAKWIGSTQGNATPGGSETVHFTREFSVVESRGIDAAVVTVTADQSYELSLNDRSIAAGHAEERVRRVDVSSLLVSGANRFTVAVKRTAEKPGHAAMIASLFTTRRDGTNVSVETDHEWIVSSGEGGTQAPAVELGPYDMAPWKLNDASIEQDDIYPSYATTVELLARLGVESDFESDADLRFIHRTDGGEEFYFIANGKPEPQSATCRFRVTGRQPEWWNPLTGERRDLPEFSQSGGRTEIPMKLEGLESGFVVFSKPLTSTNSGHDANFPSLKTVARIDSPWEVAFDPKWGGPERIVFAQLEDWCKRPEPGIRHYSGKATYKTLFDCGAADGARGAVLSLGKVANIASVKLNGHDLGVVWCAPWRIGLPEGLLRVRGNVLEIVVANLWTNRLIGDSGLPEAQRLTWTTGNPYHPEDALLESGLVGPVTIEA
jgi:hypothetical protein